MIVDLVSPWCAAVETDDTTGAQAAFRDRHALLLEPLRRARTPLLDALPLAADVAALAHRAGDPLMQQLLRETLAHAAELGAGRCDSAVLLAGNGSGDPAEPIPWPHAIAALFLDRIDDDDQLIVALAHALAAITRWNLTGSVVALHRDPADGWDRWDATRDIPLREWLYADGLGVHLAHALRPGLAAHRLLGLTPAAFSRMRQRETALRTLLTVDLDQCGIAPVLRWLVPDAPAGPRTVGELVLPPLAGRYLAWRMLDDRVARTGLREAIGMAA